MIRPYLRTDLAAVLSIFRQNTPKYFAIEEEKDLLDYLAIHGATYLVYVIDGEIVGAGGYNYTEREGKVSWYFIHPKQQGQGIGGQIVNYSLAKLNALSTLETIVVQTSQYADAFFGKFGFKTIRIEKDYWAKGLDLYEMTKKNTPMAIIRKANLQDIEGLAALFNGYRIFYKKESDLAAAKNFLTARIKQKESEIFVAEVAGKLVGFTQLYPLFSSTRMKRLWLLNDLFVDSNYRGQGISVQLIDAAKDLCRQTNACAMMLETEMSNIIGNQLYPRTDFELDTEHNHYEWTV